MSNPTETLRAILEAIPHPGGLEALAEIERGKIGVVADRDHVETMLYDTLHERDSLKARIAELEGKLAESNKANRILQTRLHNEGVNLHELDKEANALQAQVHTLREALEFYASTLGWTRSRMEIGGSVMEGDSPCECDRGIEARSALAATPEASLDAIRKATLDEAWERAEGACYGQAARASFEHITPWLKPAYFGPYASEVKW